MGKAALLVVAAFVVASAFTSSSRVGGQKDAAHRSSQYASGVLARDGALAGFEKAKQDLVSSFTSRSSTSTFEGAAVAVSVTVSGTLATITSTGTVQDGRGKNVAYTVRSQVEKHTVLPDAAPSYMQFGLIAERNLALNGNVLIDTFKVAGDAASDHNANIHTNGNLSVNGSVSVKGFGTYVGSLNLSPNDPSRFFSPYNNPTNAAVARRVARVEMPGPINLTALVASGVVDRTTNAGVVLSGVQDFEALGATRENPFIWVINGPLTVSGNVTMKGYVVFVSSGDLSVTGNASAQVTNQVHRESSVGYYSNSNIVLGGNVSMYGQFYAAGNVRFHGTPRIYGGVATARDGDVSGTPKIYFASPSPGLTQMWQTPKSTFRLASYTEWKVEPTAN